MSAPSVHQPPRRVGWLMLVSLLVMLNTHLLITVAAGIDQYSLYVADSTADWLYPSALAQKPYPALLSFLFNLVLAVFAYWLYHRIWRHFTAVGKAAPDGPKHNPFKMNAIALAMPVAIAMLPSTVLSYTELKPYFLIAGALIVIILCIVGALNSPDVELDASTRGYWFIGAVIAIFVMMSLSVIVILYFQFAPVEPPASNILWPLEWSPDSEQFERRVRGGMLMFGMSSLAYMVAVLGGVLLATLHPPGIDPRSKEHPSPTATTPLTPGPESLRGAGTPFVDVPVSNVPVRVSIPSPQAGPQPEPQQGASQPVLNIQVINMAEGGSVHSIQTEPQTEGHSARSDPASHTRAGLPEEDPPGLDQESPQETELPDEPPATPNPETSRGARAPMVNISLNASVEEWTKEILTLLENLSLESGGEALSFLASVSGQEIQITDSAYRKLIDKENGFLEGVDLFVNAHIKSVMVRAEQGSPLEKPKLATHRSNARYLGLLLFSRRANRRFTTEELREYLDKELSHRPVHNINDVPSRLRAAGIPLVLGGGVSWIKEGAKVIFLDKLSAEEPLPNRRWGIRYTDGPETPERT